MLDDSNNDTTDSSSKDTQFQTAPDPSHSEEGSEWDSPLWNDNWEGETGLFGKAHLCVAAKRWADGTVDVLVAHDPYAEAGMPTAYAHRHGEDASQLTVHGPADNVIETVTKVWGPPQERKTESHTA